MPSPSGRELGEFPLVDGFRLANLAGGGVEQFLHLGKIPGGCLRPGSEAMELKEISTAVAG